MGLLRGLIAALALLAAGEAAAQAVSERPESLSLTVYQDPGGAKGYYDGRSGLAMVTEWRTIEVPAGDSRIVFRGVAEGIVPQTAALDGLPAALLERNQDYDLLTPGSLVAGSIGAPVTRVRTNPATGAETREAAILRSGPHGVVLEIDGRYEALGCGGAPERLVFETIPAGLADKPTLSMKVRAPKGGTYRVRLSYLAVGLNWEASYVANVRADGRTLDLTGWITLRNETGTTFTEAPTQVVAGDVARSGKTRATVARGMVKTNSCWPIATAIVVTGSRVGRDGLTSAAPVMPAPPPPPPPPPAPEMKKAEQSELGDYKLYTLPYPTTVAGRQSKQLMLLDADGVSFERVQQFRVSPSGQWPADMVDLPSLTVLRTDNRKDRGLGLPLPGGKVTVTQVASSGASLIAGEYRLRNNAVGSPVDITVGQSRSVEVTPRLVKLEKRGSRTRRSYEMVVVNRTAAATPFELMLEDYGYPVKISGASHPYKAKPGGRAWSLILEPEARVVVRYTLTSDY